MSIFDNSVDLERSVLKTVLSDAAQCRLFIFRIKEDYFSSDARRFIYSAIKNEFSLSQNILPEQVLDAEICTRNDGKKTLYMGEKNIILNSQPSTNMESAIRVLHETFIGRETLSCMSNVNDLLEQGKFLEAATEFRQKAFTINLSEDTKQVVDFFSDTKNRIEKIKDKRENPDKYKGLKTGFETFDARTGGLFSGEMTLLAGVTGLGKSTILKQMEFGILKHNKGKNVLHIANEEYEDQVKYKFDAVMTGQDYLDYKFAEKDIMTDEHLKNWELQLQAIEKNSGGKLYIREVPAFSDVSVIRRVVYELKSQGINIHAIFIDHLPNMKPVQKAYGENNEREKVAAEVKELARELHVPIVIPTQAATQVEEKQMKGKRANKLDVYGSKAQIHHANSFFIITFLGKDSKKKNPDGSAIPEYQRDVFLLADVKKNRDGPCFSFKLCHEVKSGRMTELDIDPAIKAKLEKEHSQALKTGDYSTTVSSDDMDSSDSDENQNAPTSADLELKEMLEESQNAEKIPEDIVETPKTEQKHTSNTSSGLSRFKKK